MSCELKHLSSCPGGGGTGVADAAVTGVSLRGPPMPGTLPVPLPPAVGDSRGAAVCMSGQSAVENCHLPAFNEAARIRAGRSLHIHWLPLHCLAAIGQSQACYHV